ncbi:MAG: hypothetical protein GY730_07845 [bacterium]|nr:hypothetical protein [bacterium]
MHIFFNRTCLILFLVCFYIFYPGHAIFGITPVQKEIMVYDIYQSKFDTAFKYKDKIKLKLIMKRLKKQKAKLYSEINDTKISIKNQKSASERIALFEESYKKYLSLAGRSTKKKALPVKNKSFVNYHSTTGSTIGEKIDWTPAFLNQFNLHNISEFKYSDNSLSNITFMSNSSFELNDQEYQLDINHFEDPDNIRNSNFQLDAFSTQKIDLWGHKDVETQLHAQTRFQTAQSNFLLSLSAVDNKEEPQLSIGYTGSISEAAHTGYQQGYINLTDNSERNILGFMHTYYASSRMTLYPDDGIKHNLYTGINNRFRSEFARLNSNLFMNYLPNDGLNSHLLFKNRFSQKINIGLLSRYELIWDWKKSPDKVTGYNRLGASTRFSMLNTGPLRNSSKAGIDFYEFTMKSNTYILTYIQSTYFDHRKGAWFRNITSKIGRRSYHYSPNSAWSLAVYDISKWDVIPEISLDRSTCINLVLFDRPSVTNSNSVSISTGFQHQWQIDYLKADSGLSITYQHYPQNITADDFAVQFLTQIHW